MSLQNLPSKQKTHVETTKEIKFGRLLSAVAFLVSVWLGFQNLIGGILIATSMTIFLLTMIRPKIFSLPLVFQILQSPGLFEFCLLFSDHQIQMHHKNF